MSLHARQEYLQKVKKRYLKTATVAEKSQMLDEYCANTKLNRKYVISCLSAKISLQEKITKPRKKRTHKYTNRETYYLKKIWELLDYPCGQRLRPQLLEMVRVLARCKELIVPNDVIEKFKTIAASTIDEKLKPYKKYIRRKFQSTTKPGSLLKQHIPIRTSSWEETHSGYCELDTVAHCGDWAGGEFICSLTVTDMLTQWTEGIAVIGKAEKRIMNGLDIIRKRLPFTLKAIDPDNGSEFINWQLYRYCGAHSIEFTRGRPYKKNDNAHVEQKNWTHVRKVFGYERREDSEECTLMNDLFEHDLRLYKNFFQANVKLIDKKRIGTHKEKIKRIYDTAKTPYQRVLDCPDIKEEKKEQLRKIYATLNPAELKRTIEKKLMLLRQITKKRKQQKTQPSHTKHNQTDMEHKKQGSKMH